MTSMKYLTSITESESIGSGNLSEIRYYPQMYKRGHEAHELAYSTADYETNSPIDLAKLRKMGDEEFKGYVSVDKHWDRKKENTITIQAYGKNKEKNAKRIRDFAGKI
jgi:hypothetical protein